MTTSAPIYLCRHCGSPDVEEAAWIEVNTGRVTGSGAAGPCDASYCAACESSDAGTIAVSVAALAPTHPAALIRARRLAEYDSPEDGSSSGHWRLDRDLGAGCSAWRRDLPDGRYALLSSTGPGWILGMHDATTTQHSEPDWREESDPVAGPANASTATAWADGVIAQRSD